MVSAFDDTPQAPLVLLSGGGGGARLAAAQGGAAAGGPFAALSGLMGAAVCGGAGAPAFGAGAHLRALGALGALGTAHPRARNRARPNARARFARATRDERRASFFFARRRRPRRARVDGDSASTADASRSIDRGFVREG